MEWLVNAGDVVVPGDELGLIGVGSDVVVRIGPGVRVERQLVVASVAGVVNIIPSRSKVWVETNGKRYVPIADDLVIGTVVERHSEGYRVDIGSSECATLGALEFEGATKRNRPMLNPGAVVYARVVSAQRWTEPELSCTVPGSNRSWVSGESTLGELVGGNVIKVSLGTARSLFVQNEKNVLSVLGEHISYESAIGYNGRIWIKAGSVPHSVLVSLAIENAQALTQDETSRLISSLIH
uniref:Ribosomal RNA-processing protein 40 n=1 Tax=Timspurckia oligopyrenoides TaxID=708627 RepID=A0A7S0ZEN3_9RHOD|mmetsp:Transcript_2396/g.4198  ORF Transcript_2396/g.4198 Transcript_2396/m.4198 type:complete len:239 (+) Transcript_2396:112-828(+)